MVTRREGQSFGKKEKGWMQTKKRPPMRLAHGHACKSSPMMVAPNVDWAVVPNPHDRPEACATTIRGLEAA